nr:signal transduction histidine kinase, nitrate/nitrite-specific [Aureimonas sp. AU22]
MDELVRRIAFEIQDDGMSRLQTQRLVASVLAALETGDQIGRSLVVRSSAHHAVREDGPRFCSWD